MKSDTANVCWKCSDFSDIFPHFMKAIYKLKENKERTDEDAILEKVIMMGAGKIIGRDVMNNIFKYAQEMLYVSKTQFKNHSTYKICNEIPETVCTICEKEIVPYIAPDETEMSSTKFVDVSSFETLESEFYSLKEQVMHKKVLNAHGHLGDTKTLEKEVKRLSEELKNKDCIIDILLQKLSACYALNDTQSNGGNLPSKVTNLKNTRNVNLDGWNTVNETLRRERIPARYSQPFPLFNRYEGLEEDDVNVTTNSFNNRPQKLTVGITAGISGESDKNLTNNSGFNKASSIKRPLIVTNKYTENDVLHQEIPRRTVPGNSNYADISRQGKKVTLFGDSLIRKISVREFSDFVKNGVATKWFHGGATASDMISYVKPTLMREKPDSVVINIGTNNLTNGSQTANQTVQEIIEVVRRCQKYGVNDIFVSSIPCRPQFQKKVDEINKLLDFNATEFSYKFINNNNIGREHLERDRLHLNEQGINLLANNFLDSINKRSTYDSFY